MDDERYMQIALQLAELGSGQTSPNPLVGAVIVKDGEIVGQGAHLKAGGPHAEIHALRMAGDAARGATIYVTLEPCSHHGRTPPCADALIEAGVTRVVFASTDPNPDVRGSGARRLRDAGIEVVEGVLASLAERQNETFRVWVTENRPFVIWKCAATLDGYIAADSGHSNYVTSEASRDSVQQLRRQVAAIAVGLETVLHDNPRLTVRASAMGEASADYRQPVRVVFDSRLRTPITSDLLSEPGDTLIYTTDEGCRHAGVEYVAGLEKKGAVVVPMTADENGRVYLPDALTDVARRGISSLLVEGGSTLVESLIEHRLIDEVRYYVSPKFMRSGIRATKGQRTERMAEALLLDKVTYQEVGPDLLVTGYPRYDEKPRWWLGRL
ncbi:bifunctional diaminohydroxyphosphoribosylaminopyrimidine deaminase/5-amino-6-(5-phosphoribosylamino)uracil reductase RibD [Alicyclobacillus curvatus]|nr:bifunctional diaminohydroxyphosphoribosylaminopyrimidine deaminase/5-amino-6-(5-phosphoribosylamino)uracil reductase RibD [Alicyclobacillus curvatus]